jgi:hypothetical protein
MDFKKIEVAATSEINLLFNHSDETIRYAALELRKYITLMADSNIAIKFVRGKSLEITGIKLGLFNDFGISYADLSDPELDDGIYVKVQNSKGIIAGSNPRSVLFAVYRFLECCGCQWIRPGKNGEIIPSREVENLEAHLQENASNRYRGFNNCGAYSLENFMDKIEWAPKVGLNTILIEFMIPKDLFNNWYGREYYSLLEPEIRSVSDIEAYHLQAVREIKRRGLIYQAVGHGWTGAFFGLSASEIDEKKTFVVCEEERQYFALVNGKRESNHRGAIFTELCYGNPETRRRLVQVVADYAEDHPEIDLLHFWLSDARDVNCECELCRDTRPSDFFVVMLNKLDEELTSREINTRIVFLIYQELFYPPIREKIINKERFVMMYAPISRDYRVSYDCSKAEVALPPYVLNKTELWTEEQASQSLRIWQNMFQGDTFVFDYHTTWHHYYDQGYYGLTKVLAEDIAKLPTLGLKGYVGCEIVNTYFPTGFPPYLRAKMLWSAQKDLDTLADEYFKASFGRDGDLCLEYMKKLSDLFVPNFFYKWDPTPDYNTNELVLNKLAAIPEVMENFRLVIERNWNMENKTHALSWKYVFIHMDMASLLAKALRAKVEGKQEISDIYWMKVVEYIMVNEKRIQSVFDPLWFCNSFEKRHLKFQKYRLLEDNLLDNRRNYGYWLY